MEKESKESGWRMENYEEETDWMESPTSVMD